MINTFIFDFGDVFINLERKTCMNLLSQYLGINTLNERLMDVNLNYEVGAISTAEFLQFYKIEFNVSEEKIIHVWNSLIGDFPKHRLQFIKDLKQQGHYKLILLSNTNTLHINHIKEHVSFYEDFKSCFDAFYLSHEIQLRKPHLDIYQFVLDQNNLKPEHCLFIDDMQENTTAANSLGINTWNIQPKTEDVINLFKVNAHLF